MKYCPNCGASLTGGAVPFCAECGKRLPVARSAQSMRRETAKPTTAPRSQARTNTKKQNATKPAPSKPVPQKRIPKPDKCATCPYLAMYADSVRKLEPDLLDDGYDGYYDDVTPIDDGRIPEQKDPELLKRIILIAGGALAIIILSVILMSVL